MLPFLCVFYVKHIECIVHIIMLMAYDKAKNILASDILSITIQNFIYHFIVVFIEIFDRDVIYIVCIGNIFVVSSLSKVQIITNHIRVIHLTYTS